MRQSLIFKNSGRTLTSWIVFSNHQWMVVGAGGRHGNHATWLVEEETEHVLAHALIQHQNGTEWIALGQISPLRAAICTNVKVDVVIWIFHFPLFDKYLSIFWMESTWQHDMEKEKNRPLTLVLHGIKFLFYCHVTICCEFNMENIRLYTSE